MSPRNGVIIGIFITTCTQALPKREHLLIISSSLPKGHNPRQPLGPSHLPRFLPRQLVLTFSHFCFKQTFTNLNRLLQEYFLQFWYSPKCRFPVSCSDNSCWLFPFFGYLLYDFCSFDMLYYHVVLFFFTVPPLNFQSC